ncbi:MAG: Uma2 family endonuclease, partial [Halobacteriota archaeon]|nr:Uma2 family endonuclease [Halobacteriota archaeon]
MIESETLLHLPTSEELPCSDETPVDNELQYLIPYLLLSVLEFLWSERQDWFFAADMGIYYRNEHNQTQSALVPDGFLSIGLPSERLETERLSYVLWEEDEVVPLLTIEIVSKTYNEEYEDKKDKYAFLGVLYYLIYNPNYWQRDKH